MHNKNYKLFTTARLRRATWLSLVALAVLQFALASHQFDHVAGYGMDSCQVCVQLDRLDDGVADSLPLPIDLYDASESYGLVPASRFDCLHARLFDSRAPPHLI